MNYVRSIKKINNQGIIERFREFINKYKIELILLDYLNHYHSNLNIHEIVRKGLYIDFLFDMLKGLNIDVDIIYSKDNSKYNIKYDYIIGEHIIKDDEELVATDILLCRNIIDEDMSVLSPIREDYFRNFRDNQKILVYVKVKDNKKVSRKQVKMIKNLNIYKHIDKYDKDKIKNILINIYKISEDDLDELSLEKMRVLLKKKLREKLYDGLSGKNKKLKKLKLDFLLGSEKRFIISLFKYI